MRPRATYGTWYYRIAIIDVNFVVYKEKESNSVVDQKCYASGNYFIHQEDAELMASMFNKVLLDEAIIKPIEEEIK